MTNAVFWDAYCLSYLAHLQSAVWEYEIMDVFHVILRGTRYYTLPTWLLEPDRYQELRQHTRRSRRSHRRQQNKTVVVEELNIVPIEKVIEERQLSLLGHVHSMNKERLTREIFKGRVLGKQGRKTTKMDGTSQPKGRAVRYKLEGGWTIGPEQRSMEEKN